MWAFLVLVALVNKSASVIYTLNETEYDRMPPLSAADEYERCLRAGSAYCVARLHLTAGPGEGGGADRDLVHMIHEYSAYAEKHFNHTNIDRGVCIMESCGKFAADNDDMGAVVEACVNETIWDKYRIQAKMLHLFYCDEPTSEMNIDGLDLAVAYIFLILLVLNLTGTIYDVFVQKNDETGQNSSVADALLSFSVIRNWRWLISQPDPNDQQKEPLRALYGVKAICTMIIIVAHTLFLYAGYFTDNPHYFEKAFDNPLHYIIVNGLTVVQIFFVMSGFLLVYNLQIASESRPITWSLLPKILVMRLCRLTPSYAIMIAFTATWLRHLSSGLLWNTYVTQASAQCRQLWWKHLLYIQNYEGGEQINICNLPTWHLAVDIQLFVLGLVVYVMTSTRTRYLGMMLMAAVGLASPPFNVWLRSLDPITLITPETYRSIQNKTFQQMHIRAENNMTNYAIGMFLGYKVYSWQKQGLQLPKYKIFSFLSLLIVPSFFLVFSSGRIFYEGEPVPPVTAALYAALVRPVLGLIVAYALISFMFRLEDNVRGFFEWRGFVPLARLSYMVFLMHMNVILVLGGQRTHLQHASVFNVDGNLQVVIIDYQTLQASNPIMDLMHFIFTCSDEEFRSKHYERLLEHYYNELSLALRRLHVDPDEVYPKEDFDKDLEEMLPFGLCIGLFTLQVIFIDASQGNPRMEEEFSPTGIKPSPLYPERLNGIVNDYVKWGFI